MADNRKVVGYVCNEDGEPYEIKQGDKVIPVQIYDKWYEKLSERQKIDFDYNGTSYNRIMDTSFEILIALNLSAIEWKLLMLFSKKLNYNTNLIEHKNNKPITVEYIEKQLDISNKTAYRILASLNQKKIIGYWKLGNIKHLYLNPYCISKGRYINNQLKTMFKDSDFYRAYTAKYNKAN